MFLHGNIVPRLLTVSGSLRAGSSNAVLLSAVERLAPADVVVSAYTGVAILPAFNPDVEESESPLPEPVMQWRAAIADADAVLISSPEYVHGIPGALKNALDWIVGGSEIVGKPVGVLSASAASRFAHPQLIEVLKTMSAAIVPEATVVIDIPRRGVDVEQLVIDPAFAPALRKAVEALLAQASVSRATVVP
jgi:chromate reductase, NAD(P)H dehydrogenase (quinone)